MTAAAPELAAESLERLRAAYAAEATDRAALEAHAAAGRLLRAQHRTARAALDKILQGELDPRPMPLFEQHPRIAADTQHAIEDLAADMAPSGQPADTVGHPAGARHVPDPIDLDQVDQVETSREPATRADQSSKPRPKPATDRLKRIALEHRPAEGETETEAFERRRQEAAKRQRHALRQRRAREAAKP